MSTSRQGIHLNPNLHRTGGGPGSGFQQPQHNSYTPDPISTRSAGYGQPGKDGPLAETIDKIQAVSSKIEDLMEAYTQVGCCWRF
jgi:hypothetical protein